jgi:transposase
MVDMDTHQVVDVLDDRSSDSFAAWLQAHPGVEVICRDRGGCYAEGAASGAPDAIQVADRWHLLHNLSDAVDKAVTTHRRCLQPPAEPPAAQPSEPPAAAEPAGSAPPEAVEGLRAQRTRARHAEIHALREQGIGVYVIARRLGLDPKTVRRYADVTDPQTLIGPNGPTRDSILDRFKPYLQQRCAAGITSTAQLLDEITARGYTGGERTLRRWLVDIRGRDEPAPPPAPRARDITGWILRPADKLTADDRTELDRLCGLCPDLAAIRDLARGFANLLRTRTGQHLAAWIEQTEHADIPELRSFANGLRKDWDAVVAGLTMPWSSGAVEGNVNRIKMIKRKLFGRANPDLLRRYILLAD